MKINVVKRDLAGRETWRYSGEVLERGETFVRLEARFQRGDWPFQDTVFRTGDRFVETFFTDRWYNIFEIHDLDDDRVKGWYCNIGHPMVWDSHDTISYVDLALDLWVSAAGWKRFIDWDEYSKLKLDPTIRRQVREALYQLDTLFTEKTL